MKFVKLLLIISIVGSVSLANAQEEPAKSSEKPVVVEGKPLSVKQQLKVLQVELQKVQAEAVLRAQQLKEKEQILAQREKMMAEAKRQEMLAREQAQQAAKVAEDRVKEAQLAAAKAMAEAMETKVSQELQIGQYQALLQLVEKKQGPEHAYSQQLKYRLMQLESELAEISQKYGPRHPKVQQVKEKAKLLEAQLAKLKPEATNVSGKAVQLKKGAVADINAIEKALAEARMMQNDSEAVETLRGQIGEDVWKAQLARLNESSAAAARARELYKKNIMSRQEMAERENAVAMQLRRTEEMLEMQKRVLSAEYVAEGADAMGRYIQADQSGERFDRLEQKLDKIASLLEKMIDKID